MKNIYIILFMLGGSTGKTNSQPYIDIMNGRYSASPALTNAHEATRLDYANLSVNIPFQFHNNDVLILSPYIEKWKAVIKDDDQVQSYYGITFPVSFLKHFEHSSCGVLATGLVRMNAEEPSTKIKLQFGGAALVLIKKTGHPHLEVWTVCE